MSEPSPENAGRDPDALMRRAGVRGDPRRDQHFLVDDRVLSRIPEYAVAAGFELGHVLEIGAGTGALTDRLLSVANRVTAIERDRELATFLEDEFADAIRDDRLDVIAGDAREVDFPKYTAAISNLPYGAASELLFRLLPVGRPFVVMVQREFADRLVAEPGTADYGRLSVTAGHYAAIEICEIVPPEAFEPPPAVESAVVRAVSREPDYTVPDAEDFLSLVTAVFTQRRKTLRNAIRNTAHISGLSAPDELVSVLDDELLGRRPGTLSPAEFAHIAVMADRIKDREVT